MPCKITDFLTLKHGSETQTPTSKQGGKKKPRGFREAMETIKSLRLMCNPCNEEIRQNLI
jgi:hypothetical protein